ncbi:MAG: response regulator transcription factor [Bacteroidota bacterium]
MTKALRKFLPGSKIIGLSVFSLPGYAKKMIQAGAKGYVTKNSSCAELVEAILEVHLGTKYICREICDMVAKEYLEPEDVFSDINKLTTRELDIIHYIKVGYSSKEIAIQTGLSIKTVEVHRYNILRKLNLRNAASLVNFINQKGL